ncbi:MAG: RNA methyltransferase tRNA(m5U54)methyltransferase [Chrysothrix sp. TS-e1954]|nr:MAG: RNA methyltransferase tRNA(m5U54)methyltransferase [Chrysothrix sp. TS-e1954]
MARLVTIDGHQYGSVTEGLATILQPHALGTTLQKDDKTVFYNPIQQFNRDLSVLAIQVYAEDEIAVQKHRKERKSKQEYRKRRPPSPADDLLHQNPLEVQASRKRKFSAVEPDVAAQENASSAATNNAQASGPHSNGLWVAMDNSDSCTNHWRPRFSILDALSATGLRALRYAKEVPSATQITANDLSSKATDAIKTNVKYNDTEDKTTIITGDALSHMYTLAGRGIQTSRKYHVIDLDPYGTAAPFLDAALQALTDGGLLCVTCTDSGVWASTGYSEKAYALYGGTPIKGLHCHEGGIRLILHSIATTAARYGIAIEPLLSLSIDFYVRVFVRIHHSSAEVKLLAAKTMLVYGCDQGCGSWELQHIGRTQSFKAKNDTQVFKHSLAQGPSSTPTCEHCGFKTHLSGPMFAGPLHNTAFVKRILARTRDASKETYGTVDRIEGMLTTAIEEETVEDTEIATSQMAPLQPTLNRPVPLVPSARVDRHPFYFVPSALARILHCVAPSDAAFKGALRSAGYKASRSHAKAGSIKTNAPWTFIWSIMREWVRRQAPIKEDSIKQGSAGWKIWHGVTSSNASQAQVAPKAIEQSFEHTIQDANRSVEVPHDEQIHCPQPMAKIPSEAPANIVFDENLGREKAGKHLVRYQTNPKADWGPMSRAKQ